jgi:hypothetical protein
MSTRPKFESQPDDPDFHEGGTPGVKTFSKIHSTGGLAGAAIGGLASAAAGEGIASAFLEPVASAAGEAVGKKLFDDEDEDHQ